MTEWFEQWFGEEYLRLYPHRDEADAERAVALIDRVAKLDGARCWIWGVVRGGMPSGWHNAAPRFLDLIYPCRC